MPLDALLLVEAWLLVLLAPEDVDEGEEAALLELLEDLPVGGISVSLTFKAGFDQSSNCHSRSRISRSRAFEGREGIGRRVIGVDTSYDEGEYRMIDQ